MKRRPRFRPPLWAWLAFAAVGAAFVLLGLWQIRRGQDEQALIRHLAEARRAPPVELSSASTLPQGQPFEHAAVSGVYDAARQILIDGQEHAGETGYDVLTPLRLADGGWLLVNRGFVAAGSSGGEMPNPPVPTGPQRLRGLWRAVPRPALQLGVKSCPPERFPQRLSYPTPHQLRCLYGDRLLPGELLLDPDLPGGFVRNWKVSPGFPPSRHYGYAAQWFAFLIVLVVLFVKLNLKSPIDQDAST